MPPNKISWLNFIGDMQQQRYAPDQLQVEGFEKILNVNELTNSVLNHSIPWIYLLDYTSSKYMLVSKSMKLMLGFDPEDMMNEGLAWTLENYHADHLRLFNEDIFPDRLQVLKSIPRMSIPTTSLPTTSSLKPDKVSISGCCNVTVS